MNNFKHINYITTIKDEKTDCQRSAFFLLSKGFTFSRLKGNKRNFCKDDMKSLESLLFSYHSRKLLFPFISFQFLKFCDTFYEYPFPLWKRFQVQIIFCLTPWSGGQILWHPNLKTPFKIIMVGTKIKPKTQFYSVCRDVEQFQPEFFNQNCDLMVEFYS